MNAFCEIYRGFFIKRGCGHASVMQCEQCQRAICPSHQAPAALPRLLCVDCAAAGPDTDRGSWSNDPYRYRRQYYDSGYTPIFWDDSPPSQISSVSPTDQPPPPAGANAPDPSDGLDATDVDPSTEKEPLDGDDDTVSAFDS